MKWVKVGVEGAWGGVNQGSVNVEGASVNVNQGSIHVEDACVKLDASALRWLKTGAKIQYLQGLRAVGFGGEG